MNSYKYFTTFFLIRIFFGTAYSRSPEIICNHRILWYATEKILQDTAPYHALNPQEYYAYIAQSIADGGYYTYQIITDHIYDIPLQTQPEYLRSLISICWYLYAEELLSGTTDIGFIEGAFIIQDPHKKLFNFFKGYVDLIASLGYSTCWAWGLIAANPFAYQRQATHMVNEHFGIDIHPKEQEPGRNLLFAGKKHLLFSHYICPQGVHHFYIKPENHGLGLGMDLLHHTKELCYSKLRLHPNQPNYRKERIHKEIRSEIAHICSLIRNKTIRKKIQAAGKQSIAYLIKELQTHMEYFTLEEPWILRSIEALHQILCSNYTHLEQRIGNEVYIATIDLMLSSYFYVLEHEDDVATHSYKQLLESFYKIKQSTALYRYKRETLHTKPSFTTLVQDAENFIHHLEEFSLTLPDTIHEYLHTLQKELIHHLNNQSIENIFVSSHIFEEKSARIS